MTCQPDSTGKQKTPGKVYLVGAGPGDPGLLTVKGRDLLSKAEVVIYDRLASPKLLSMTRPDAQLIYVGKRIGKHAVSQSEINRLLVKHGLEGKMVVRLKGGDPFIFGRGGEEAEELVKHCIPFEVVPGVSSAIAAAAYSGIPITHRCCAASLAIITGHRKFEVDEAAVDWEGIARTPDTLVFLMAMTNLQDIASELIKHGRSADTPAAVIEWGTTSRQRTVCATLADITQKVKEARLGPPSVIVVGEVVALKKQLDWFETRPLFGKKVVVTRSRDQASELTHLLEEQGAVCIETPTIELMYPDDLAPLDQAISCLEQYDWIIFSSPNAVQFFFKRLDETGNDARRLGRTKIAVIGTGTAQSLKQHRLNPDLVPQTFQAEGLIEAFQQQEMKGKKVLVPRAVDAREVLRAGLEMLGAIVDVVFVYKNTPVQVDEYALEELKKGVDALTFTSSSTVKNFMQAIPADIMKMALSDAKIVCIGPITAQTASKHGLSVTKIATQATISSLAEAVIEAICNHTGQGQ